MEIRRGTELIGTMDSIEDFRVGDSKPAFIFKGDELVYPNYIKDGLVLHYDFKGMTNTDVSKGIAHDLSGNGNHGTLNNFAYAEGSGYQDDGLKFDGVDDTISNISINLDTDDDTISFVSKINASKRNHLLYAGEDLKLDLYWNRISRAELTPTVNVYHNEGDELFHTTLVKDGFKHIAYINGEKIQEDSLEKTRNLKVMNIGNYIPTGMPNIDLYDVKIYTRPLSPEEIQHNYEIEKARFNLGGDE